MYQKFKNHFFFTNVFKNFIEKKKINEISKYSCGTLFLNKYYEKLLNRNSYYELINHFLFADA